MLGSKCGPPSDKRLRPHPSCEANIFYVWSCIAEDSADAADRVEQAIYDACDFLAEAPLRGHSKPDLTLRSLLFWTLTRYPNYSVIYRPGTTPLQVVAVVHGKRNIQSILTWRP